MSSSSTSSRTPSPVPMPKASQKARSKDKGQKKSTLRTESHGKNEGVDPTWVYKPPANFGDLKDTTYAGEFDWDAVETNDDVELWLIRVPESVKPKHLEKTSIELTASSKSIRAGTINRKHASFDIWSVGDDDDQHVGGEEIKGLSCLLPRRSKNGKLYPTSKPFARHLVISAQAAQPSIKSLPDDSSDPVVKYENPPRQRYPKEVLKHRFMPYGSITGLKEDASVENMEEFMAVDVPEDLAPGPSMKPTQEAPSASPKEAKKAKGKKRKGDGEVPAAKKSKKVKTA